MSLTLPTSCIIDASVAIKWFLIEVDSDHAIELLNLLENSTTQFHVPDLMYIEITNILWSSTKRGRLTEKNAHEYLTNLKALRLISHQNQSLISSALDLSFRYNISAYDASYVALSQKLGLPMITADARLQRAVSSSFDVRLL